LERTLGIRIERLTADQSTAKSNNGIHIRTESAPVTAHVPGPVTASVPTSAPRRVATRPTMIALPGEVLQAQIES
jgi:hypothetical protein